jgi:hypothetical protein
MEALNTYKFRGGLKFGKIGKDGKLIDGVEDMYYYDPKYDVWCIYEDHTDTGNYNCYYMKSNGKVFLEHADPRRFIGGVAKFYRTDKTEQVGNKTYIKRYLYNNEGKCITDCGYCGIKRLEGYYPIDSQESSTEPHCEFEVALFPSKMEKEMYGEKSICKHYKIKLNLKTWGYTMWELNDILFKDAIKLGE